MLEKARLLSVRRGPLDPIDRFSEIIFGLIMALSFTGTISVAAHGRAEVRTLLAAALGCNIAWGIVDGVMFWLTRMVERCRSRAIGEAIRKAPDFPSAQTMIHEALPDDIAPLFETEDLQRMVEKVRSHHPSHRPPLFTRDDLLGAFLVCILVILSTFPVALPFIFISKVQLALRVSNGVAVASLFLLGVSLGRFSGQRKTSMGLIMVCIGVVLVLTTIQLGG